MKYCKRILPLLLVLAMLAGMMIPVAAQEVEATLSLNEEAAVTVDWENPKMFAFVPEEDGYYAFISTGSSEDPYGEVYDSNMNVLDENDDGGEGMEFVARWWASAGETYYLKATGRGSYNVQVLIAGDAAAMELLSEGSVLAAGKKTYLWVEFYPSYAIPEDVTFTSSDETVATVDQNGTVQGLSAGTVVITATSEKGLTATCTITVEAPLLVSCGEDITVVLGEGNKEYTFIPEADGWYGVYSLADWEQYPYLEPYVRIENANSGLIVHSSNDGSEQDFLKKVYLSADDSYFLDFSSYSYNDGDRYIARIVPLVEEPTGLELNQTTLSLELGQEEQLSATTIPTFSWGESVTWTSSDDSVAMVNDHGYVQGMSVGTAVITATSESGLTATCTVTVITRPIIELDQIMDLDAADGTVRYTFVPEKEGWYAFCSMGEEVDPVANVYDEYGNELGYDDDSGEWANFCACVYLDAETTYILQTKAFVDEGAYQVWIQEILEPTALEMSESELTGFAGAENWLWIRYLPAISIPQNVTWSSSDESVVTVDEEGCYCLIAAGTATITATAENGLTASCTVTVKDVLNLSIENPVTLLESDGEQRLKFIPETTDDYVFYSIGENADPACWLYSSNLDYLDDDWDGGEKNNFRLEYPLIAGEVYYLEVRNESGSLEDDDDTYTVCVHNVEEATGIQLSHTQITGAPDTNIRLEASMIPQHTRPEEMTWTSSDPSIVEVDDDGWLYLCGKGTAVITVTSESGFTASCTVTSQFPEGGETIRNGQSVTIPEQLGASWLEFVPPEDAWYFFTFQLTNKNASCYFYNEQWVPEWGWVYGDEDGDIQHYGIELKAGQTYYLCVNFREVRIAGNGTVTVDQMDLPTGIALNINSATGVVTNYVNLEAEVSPQYAIPEITWTSSDENVAKVDQSGFVQMTGPGTATITATTVNGLSATCTVTVSEPAQIVVGDTVTLNSADGYVCFRFIPESDGWYGFYTTGEYETYGYLQTVGFDTDYYFTYLEDYNGLIRCQMKAGRCYYVTFTARADEEDPGSFELHAATLEKPQKLVLEADRLSCYVDEEIIPDYHFLPALSEVEEVIFTSSDESVAQVDRYGWIQCVAPGTVVITATTESGMTDSLILRVVETPEDAEDYGKWGDDLLWQIKDGVLTVTGTGNTYNQSIWGDYTRVELPEGLTGLGDDAFNCATVESITIPAGVTSIGARAFGGSSASEIRFLGHAPIIGENAFGDLWGTIYYPANDPTWTEEVRQNYGGEVTWVAYEPEEASGFALEGKIEVGDGGATTVELLNDGDVIDSVASSAGKYRFEDLAPGIYTLRVSKECHVTREYTVTVADEDVFQDVKLHLIGDIDGSGTVNMGDISMQYAHIKGTKRITDGYQLLVANIDGNALNMGDFAALYAHIKGTKKLY